MFIQRSSLEVDCIHYSFLVPPGYFLHVSIPFSVLFYPFLSLSFSLSLSHTHTDCFYSFFSLPPLILSFCISSLCSLSLSLSHSMSPLISLTFFLLFVTHPLSLSLHLFPSLFSLLMFCLTISHCLCQSVCLSVVLLMAPTKDLNIYF